MQWSGVTRADAMARYCDALTEVCPEWRTTPRSAAVTAAAPAVPTTPVRVRYGQSFDCVTPLSRSSGRRRAATRQERPRGGSPITPSPLPPHAVTPPHATADPVVAPNTATCNATAVSPGSAAATTFLGCCDAGRGGPRGGDAVVVPVAHVVTSVGHLPIALARCGDAAIESSDASAAGCMSNGGSGECHDAGLRSAATGVDSGHGGRGVVDRLGCDGDGGGEAVAAGAVDPDSDAECALLSGARIVSPEIVSPEIVSPEVVSHDVVSHEVGTTRPPSDSDAGSALINANTRHHDAAATGSAGRGRRRRRRGNATPSPTSTLDRNGAVFCRQQQQLLRGCAAAAPATSVPTTGDEAVPATACTPTRRGASVGSATPTGRRSSIELDKGHFPQSGEVGGGSGEDVVGSLVCASVLPATASVRRDVVGIDDDGLTWQGVHGPPVDVCNSAASPSDVYGSGNRACDTIAVSATPTVVVPSAATTTLLVPSDAAVQVCTYRPWFAPFRVRGSNIADVVDNLSHPELLPHFAVTQHVVARASDPDVTKRGMSIVGLARTRRSCDRLCR